MTKAQREELLCTVECMSSLYWTSRAIMDLPRGSRQQALRDLRDLTIAQREAREAGISQRAIAKAAADGRRLAW